MEAQGARGATAEQPLWPWPLAPPKKHLQSRMSSCSWGALEKWALGLELTGARMRAASNLFLIILLCRLGVNWTAGGLEVVTAGGLDISVAGGLESAADNELDWGMAERLDW